MRFLRSTVLYRERDGKRCGGEEPSQGRSKYLHISDARDNYKEWMDHVPKMEEFTRIPELCRTDKSVANIDLGQMEKR
jgi:hypothetical protein